ncbi:MAG: ligase-associated DNA damage response DEXH box helicase [Bacteroidota bacterium]
MNATSIISTWLNNKGWSPFAFQEETWHHMLNGKSGLVNAPTGCGKTYSVFVGALIRFMEEHPEDWNKKRNNGLRLLWITPLRALAKDIGRAMGEAIAELGMQWRVGIRNGDTSTTERQKQKKHAPEILIITPESLHVLLSTSHHEQFFSTLDTIAVDEWHELLGSKRGVQVELAISRIIQAPKQLPVLWGISATIGNLNEAQDVLLHPVTTHPNNKSSGVTVTASMEKQIELFPIFPDEIEHYPWAGHLGIKLAHKLVPIIEASRSTLIFINTRGMSEIWYQTLLSLVPDWAGAIALHHGSIDCALRVWVEEALHEGRLKAVVCTASLDLGVDFRPVETVIQVGSPKGVARFLQRAGRSGHAPGAVSRIYFLPTHSLELVEAAALKEAIELKNIEAKPPQQLCFDVLTQYLCTLAAGDGFDADKIKAEVSSTFCFREMMHQEWQEVIAFITTGGNALQQYDEFQKIVMEDDQHYRMQGRRTIMRHRMHIGTIVSDAMLKVKWMSGGYIGVIEEWFISKLEPGDVFSLAGRNVELVSIQAMTVLVRKSNAKKSIVPSWMGGRMPLTANMGYLLRKKLSDAAVQTPSDPILQRLAPLMEQQANLSHIPSHNELLVEMIETKDGHHLFVHTFEGRLVNEAMAAILAWRISKIQPISFTFAMNDYSFELLSDQPIPVDEASMRHLFSSENLSATIQQSVNATEMAKRKFRDIAVIGGLIFQGMPGQEKKARHLQSSASLLFNVFLEYDRNNLLMRQAFNEVMQDQMEESRLRAMLHRIEQSTIVLTRPKKLTPFSFPVKVDSIRENVSSEKLEDRVKKMIQGN